MSGARFAMYVTLVAGLLGSIMLGGCSTSGVNRLDTATASVDETRAQLEVGVEQLDAVIESLQAFETTDDLKKALDDYSKNLAKLEKAADSVRARRAAMQTRMDDHIAKWQAELEGISNPDLKTISAERQAQLVEALEKLGASLDELNDEYQPLVSNLRDIELVMANDLSAGGMKVLQPLIGGAVDQAEAVREAVARVDTALADAIAEFQR